MIANIDKRSTPDRLEKGSVLRSLSPRLSLLRLTISFQILKVSIQVTCVDDES